MVNIDINDLLKKVTDFINNLPEIIKKAPKDEQIAYGAVGAGIAFLLIGIMVRVIAALI